MCQRLRTWRPPLLYGAMKPEGIAVSSMVLNSSPNPGPLIATTRKVQMRFEMERSRLGRGAAGVPGTYSTRSALGEESRFSAAIRTDGFQVGDHCIPHHSFDIECSMSNDSRPSRRSAT